MAVRYTRLNSWPVNGRGSVGVCVVVVGRADVAWGRRRV